MLSRCVGCCFHELFQSTDWLSRIPFTRNQFHEYNCSSDFQKNSDLWIWVSPHVHDARYHFTLGDPFKKIVTSLPDPFFPSGHSRCAFPHFITNGFCSDTSPGWMMLI